MSSTEKWLRQAAEEIRREGHAGWGNTCEQAADHIAELEKAARAVVEAERQDSNVGLYLERAVDALGALLGGGEK